MGSAPLARKGHFVYGILDLLQRHVSAMVSGKFDKAVIDLTLRVVEVSKYSFLRCKAFEVLATFSTKHGVGQMPIKRMNEILQRRDVWSNVEREKVSEQWRVIRNKVLVDDEHMIAELRMSLPDRLPTLDPEEPIISVYSSLMAKETEYKEKERNLRVKIKQLESEYSRIESAHTLLAKRCQDLDKDNDILRSRIATMCTAEEPVHEENFYALKFIQINHDIESWTAKETREKPAPLTAENLETVISGVNVLGSLTPSSIETLKVELLHFHEDRRLRIALIRHIIAVLLFDGILDRYAYGLNRQSSNYFKFIESHICNRGTVIQRYILTF